MDKVAELQEKQAATGRAPETDWALRMREEWDARAAENARYFIATEVPDCGESFFASGRADYDRLVRPFLRDHAFDPANKTALEVGCGIGRMTQAFAQEFGEVIGLDISPEMISRARGFGLPNAKFVVGNGREINGIAEASVDFAFSYIVFQHIPEEEAILRYVAETGRVLRPGGLFLLHMNGLPHVRLGALLFEGYFSESPRLRRFGVKKLPWIRRRVLGTWMGHPVALARVRRICRRAGLKLMDVRGRWTQQMWVGGRKAADRMDDTGNSR
jgi:SAM-dependent methyltransferase